MARFEQLRLVPMLIQAYHNARVRIDTAQTGVEKPDIPAMTAGSKKSPLASANGPRRKQATSKQHLKKNSATTVPEGPNDVTARLLREVRATNRKLKGLDEVRRQLKSLGSSLDEFNRQIGELKTNAVSNQVIPEARADDFAKGTPAIY